MRNSDQPQNTEKLVRDAAVQINEEEKDLQNKDLFHMEHKAGEVKSKTNVNFDESFERLTNKVAAINAGALKMQEQWPEGKYEYAFSELTWICGQLTSANKLQRDIGKKALRDLVKLGQQTIDEQQLTEGK